MITDKNKFRDIELTIPQFIASTAPQKHIYLEMTRGSGKTFIFAKRMLDLCKEMPKSSIALVGPTYVQILNKTLPSAIEGLAMFGFYQDVDYVIGRSGKKHGFEMPFQPPQQWNNIIHFSNGTIFQLVSLDNPNSGRGLNAYAEMGDEALTLDPDKLGVNVKATNRSKKKEFEKSRLLGSEFYVSSTPITKKGQWFVEKEKEAKLKPKEILFLSATSKSNPHIQADYEERMKTAFTSNVIYEAEILNIRPKSVKDGFYANINPNRHYYLSNNDTYLESVDISKKYKSSSLQDNDIDFHSPLILSFDFGVFNSMVISQAFDNEYRVLNSLHVHNPKLLDDLLIDEFIPYYRLHKWKVAYIYGGHDGHNRLANSSRTLFEQIKDILTKHGWTVYVQAKKVAPSHADKYLLINAMLKETEPNLPVIRINEQNNPDLIKALESAEAKEGLKGIEKNKSSERNQSIPQEHATHYTDAFDMPIYHRYNDKFVGKSSSFGALGGIMVG